jgi:hypothetical protein
LNLFLAFEVHFANPGKHKKKKKKKKRFHDDDSM